MAKKATKNMFVPVRRAVKRGAPPIIKPRRMMAAKPGALTGQARPATRIPASPTKPQTEIAGVPGVVDEEADAGNLNEIALAEASTVGGDSSPEELAELEKAALAEREEEEHEAPDTDMPAGEPVEAEAEGA